MMTWFSNGKPVRCLASFAAAIAVVSVTGCAAMHPLDGIAVCELPMEYRASHRSAQSMIDLSLLRQTPPDAHLVDSDDVLSIYVEGILGGAGAAPPLNIPQNPNGRSSLGYPIRIRDDGSISLPKVDRIPVRGMTIAQVEVAIRNAYTTSDKPPLVAAAERIFVDLQRPRHFKILVMRQESGGRTAVSGTVGRRELNQSTDKKDSRVARPESRGQSQESAPSQVTES